MIMVGMGLDTGQLTYVRSQGQAAVDAAALSAVTGLPLGDTKVTGRVDDYNSTNNYVESATNKIGGSNITYVNYDPGTGAITSLPSIAGANGVRVGLEQKNPYTGETPGTGITTPVFLTPLMNSRATSTGDCRHQCQRSCDPNGEAKYSDRALSITLFNFRASITIKLVYDTRQFLLDDVLGPFGEYNDS
jgi:Flp pilus assembly protein TadG